jgi:sulfate permease, SulP family
VTAPPSTTARHRERRWERLRADGSAGLLLGVESVPDGLASGVLAGVNPLAGLYAYLYGMVGAACVTSSSFMAVQATGAMSLVVADADLERLPDPDRALFTLAVLTGLVMAVAGVLRAGSLLRFVPTAVMTGFITAVGVNIVLGQLSNLTGYAAQGANRLARTLDLLLHPGRVDGPTLCVGLVTLALIVALGRTPLGSMGMVVAIVVGSGIAALWQAAGDAEVAVVSDLATLPGSLPGPVLPVWGDMPALLLPALSLAFVGLVQGAAVSASIPNPDGRPTDASRDFVGQGAGNIAAGLFQGMPVGGSMSASSLVVAGGARSRLALFIAGAVMVLVILVLGDVVGRVAMPSLAALLIVVGAGAIKPAQIRSVVKTGPLQGCIMGVTFVLTIMIPLQYAVVVGVALAIVLFVVQQSNRVVVRRLELDDAGRVRESEPPATVSPDAVLVLQPYGSLFFASAPVFRAQLPEVDAQTRNAVVILRLRGYESVGLAFVSVLDDYLRDLRAAGSTLKLVVSDDRVARHLAASGLLEDLGDQHVYRGTEWLGETVRQAYADALEEVEQHRRRPGHGPTPP